MLPITPLNSGWVSGFIDGEGNFAILLNRNPTITLGYQAQLRFSVCQHVRDWNLLSQFITFFGGGAIYLTKTALCEYRLQDIDLLKSRLFAHLDAYPLLTRKSLDEADFRRAYAIIKNKQHLTKDGLDDLRTLQRGMNRGRKLLNVITPL